MHSTRENQRPWTRRRLLTSTGALGLTLLAGGSFGRSSGAQEGERPGPLPADQVETFVRVAHGDLGQVKSLLAEEPRLVNATWDWGGGDFESALGAASHMGPREIALHLLDQGARLDLFAAAMLGRLTVVRAALEADPAALHVPGAHGIPLIAHAMRGGDTAQPVVDYLQGLLG